MSNIIDVSMTLGNNATTYPEDAQPVLRFVCEIGDDAPCSITQIDNMTTHLLTHVDVPAHFIRDGATLDQVPLTRFQGPAIVVDATGSAVTTADVPDNLTGLCVLFRTANSQIPEGEPFRDDHVHITPEAADLLVARGASMVGIDYLSVDAPGDEEYQVHRTLLASDVLIIEGLRLADAPQGRYHLWALPLKIASGDGGPVRAVLVQE